MLNKLTTILLSKKQLTHNVYEFTFLCKEPQNINYLPGQYMILVIPNKEKKIKRLYSIFNFENKTNEFKMAVKIIPDGIGSSYLTNLKENERVEFEGPAGVFTLNKSEKQKIFLATGTGIMPILSIVFSAVKTTTSKLSLLWGLREKSDIFYFNILQQMTLNNQNFTFGIFISREQINKEEKNIFSGRINIGIEKMFSDKTIDLNNTEFYICGNKNNVDSVRNYLLEKGIRTEDIKTERFG